MHHRALNLIAAVAALGLVVSSGGATQASARARLASFPSQGHVQNAATDKCMGVDKHGAARPDANDRVIQWDCLQVPDQHWDRPIVDDHEWHEIHNYGNNYSDTGLCLDVPGSSTTPGTGLILWSCNGGDNQLWTLEGSSIRGCYILKNKHSGQLVGVPQGRRDLGLQVVQWPWAGVPDQTWC